MGLRIRRRAARAWGFAAIIALLWGVGAGTAHALTIVVSADATATIDVRVDLEARDGSGTVLLVRDGLVVGERPSGGLTSLDFAGVPLTPGSHHFRATMRSSAGFTSSRPLVHTYSWGVPLAPRWVAPTGGYVASPVDVRVYAGASTSSMTLTVNGTLIKTVACVPGQFVSFGKVTVGSGPGTYMITAGNPYGDTATFSTTAKPVRYPYSTCIIVDKSDFKLYWIRADQLVKAYPIAHGKGSCTPLGTWKVLAKYKTDPGGIYGPRKMRLFSRSGGAGHYRYSYTAYGIHGTNQPWVIGTMASHGCIRMYNKDVLELWPQVPLGTMVITRR
jgi:lipoprotein-anchoring transpeptidase ErfK/SrfK